MAFFRISPEVFERLPNLCVAVVVARGVDNQSVAPDIGAMLVRESAEAHARLAGANIKEYPPIAYFRDAFQTLGINPNKFMCSIEALFKRVAKGGAIPSINQIVDLGNSISLKYSLPIGAHDIGKLVTDLEVRFSTPDDRFVPFGGLEAETLAPGELVYVSGNTVKTRRWIWRQSEDGKIDSTTSDVVFPIDCFRNKNLDIALAACEELKMMAGKHLSSSVKSGLLSSVSGEMEL